MAETLRIVSHIDKPFVLLGFVIAIAFYAFVRWLGSQEKKLGLLPPNERSKSKDNSLSRYNIDGGNLTREHKFHLIGDETIQ